MFIGKVNISPRHKAVPWWNKDCGAAIKASNSALNKFRRTRNPVDLIEFKRLKAFAKRIIKNSKKNSWNKYVSNMTRHTTPGQVWTKIRQMKGGRSNTKISALATTHGDLITEDQQIANAIGSHLHEKTNNPSFNISNSSPSVSVSLNVDNHDINSLNLPFSTSELSFALSSCRNSAAGPDGIPFLFLKNLSALSLSKLLDIYNNIWLNNVFPKIWRTSIVLPIKKPDKPSTDPSTYRPISLTCTMCKLLEKMINERLIWFLEKYHIICSHQSGFRKQRSALDNLVSLQTFISDAFLRNQEVVATLFDIESAFDTLPTITILDNLKNIHLSGNISQFIKNFLINRTFRVSANGKLSSTFRQLNGVPQGSILSPTLFIIAINSICNSIPPPVKYVLYADDLIMYCRGATISSICSLLQAAVNCLSSWSAKTGLQFSSSKSKIIKFSRKRAATPIPRIWLNNIQMPVVNHHRILGLTFDCRLNWKLHIQNIKGDCMNRLNILKTVAHHQWGAEEEILLQMYRALIRSKLDYGSPVYSSASEFALKSLDTVHNSALRICLGAFRTSPSESLYCEANELPLGLRRQQLLLSYSARVSANPQNPVYPLITSTQNDLLASSAVKPLPYIIKSLISDADLSLTTVSQTSPTPPWKNTLPELNTSLHAYSKYETPHQLLKQSFSQIVNPTHFNKILFTDASKSQNGVSCSVTTTHDTLKTCILPSISCIHTGELFGILKAINCLSQEDTAVAICTDSLASIQSIKNIFTVHPLVRNIHESINRLASSGVCVTIVWVPSHIGIAGNEKADRAAREAFSQDTPIENLQIHSDLKCFFKQQVRDRWQTRWNQAQSKLHDIQPTTNPIKLPNMPREKKIILRRLRIGHTKLTHKYLLTSENPPLCLNCHNPLTVNHILVECTQYIEQRSQHQLKGSRKDILSQDTQFDHLISYLHDINLYDQI